MTRGDIGRLLAYMAAFDKRTIGDADVIAWHDAVGDLDFRPALEAVRRWYGIEGNRWIMPGDVRGGCVKRPELKPVREAIREAGGDPDLPFRPYLVPALAAVADKRTMPGQPRPTGYRPDRPRPQRPKKGPETDEQRAKAGKAITICHRCAVDISVPDGWDPNSEKSSALFCGPCTAQRRKEATA